MPHERGEPMLYVELIALGALTMSLCVLLVHNIIAIGKARQSERRGRIHLVVLTPVLHDHSDSAEREFDAVLDAELRKRRREALEARKARDAAARGHSDIKIDEGVDMDESLRRLLQESKYRRNASPPSEQS